MNIVGVRNMYQVSSDGRVLTKRISMMDIIIYCRALIWCLISRQQKITYVWVKWLPKCFQSNSGGTNGIENMVVSSKYFPVPSVMSAPSKVVVIL
jgi:hypothetical protein